MSTEQKTKTVRLDGEVIDSLANLRRGFETPNDCLKRLLGERNCLSESKTKSEDKVVQDNES